MNNDVGAPLASFATAHGESLTPIIGRPLFVTGFAAAVRDTLERKIRTTHSYTEQHREFPCGARYLLIQD